jgi:hypothetical protein
MERLYSKVGLPIKNYPRRGMLLLKPIGVLLNDLQYSLQSWGKGFLRK